MIEDIFSNEVTRRQMLIGAASVAGVATLGSLLPRTIAGVHLIITDPRFSESAPFRDNVGSGVPHITVEADLGQQWYAGLREAVRNKTIVGLTSWIDFVVLSGGAREEGLKVVSTKSIAGAGRIHQVSWVMAPRQQ